jgi:hypothetical protein
MTTKEAYPRLLDSLSELRRQWRSQKILEGVLLAAAGIAGVIIVTVAADNLFQLETAGRVLLAVVLWGGLIACIAGLVVRRYLEDRRDDFFAALVEQKHPELHNQLINALQLGRGSQNGHSPVLIEAIVNDAVNATADMEMDDSIDRKPVKRAVRVSGVVVALLAIYAIALWPRFANGLTRVLLPGADIPAYTATQVALETKDNLRVPEGEQVALQARVSGELPPTARVFRDNGDGLWQPAQMQRGPENDRFTFVVQPNESFDYYVVAGDGRSKRQRVEVVKRPAVETLSLTYTPPSYTALPPRQVPASDGEISGLAGTKVDIVLKATKALQQAKFIIREGDEVKDAIELQRVESDKSGATWQASFVLWSKDAKGAGDFPGRQVVAPARYRIELRDTFGYDSADPLTRSIGLMRDAAPTVVLSRPGRDLHVKPGEKVPLTVHVRDDFGIGDVRILFRVNRETTAHELVRLPHTGAPKLETIDDHVWDLSAGNFKPGTELEYWAEAADRNTITGPGKALSRPFKIALETSDSVAVKVEENLDDYAKLLEDLLLLQRTNRAETASDKAFLGLATRQNKIRTDTGKLARRMEKDALPLTTMVKALDDLRAGLMVDAVRLLESGRDATDAAKAAEFRAQSLPVQDKIIEQLEALLARLQRNENAREALKRIKEQDKVAHKKISEAASQMIKAIDKLLDDQTKLAEQKFERLPKKMVDEHREEVSKSADDLERTRKKIEKWAKGGVNELTKLPEGFTDDFKLRKDVNRVFEEVEKQPNRPKADKAEVSLEDLGAGMATKMKEDLETWLLDSPDATKWVLEEPLNKKPLKVPEMPLPEALEDLIGDLLQKADEFDEEADDKTSAWGDNLDQAGWGVADGPISLFSAKGKTGNDMPNNNEQSGRSGDGRRGKSSGQMAGDTSRALDGRKTPARVGNERYEPGQLKQEKSQDPNGATGGGKKTGAGQIGLQGGTPPDYAPHMERLSNKQAGLREKMEQVAEKLDTTGIKSRQLKESIQLMKASEQDLRNNNYEDAARKRKVAIGKLRNALGEVDQTAAQLSRARDLPPQLRSELLQAADEGYPPGYESLLKNYFKALSTAEK